MAFELDWGEDPGQGIKRIITEVIDQAVLELTTAPEGPHLAVHFTRKSCKRIRAALRLVRDALGAETYRQENAFYRDTSRRLAEVRDSLVIIYALDALAINFAEEITPGSFGRIRQRLFDRHETVSAQIIGDGRILDQVANALQGGRERVMAWPLEGEGFDLLAPGLARVYRRGRRRMRRSYASGDGVRFHDWRKRVKYLWHQMEILRPIWPARLDGLVVDLKQVSDYLGDAHDLVALGHVLQDEPAVAGEDPALPQLLNLLERWRVDFEAAARPLGARLYKTRPKQFVNGIEAFWREWREEGPFDQGPSLSAIRAASITVEETCSYESGYDELAKELFSTTQAAKRLGLTPSQVRRLIREGQLPAAKIGAFWVIRNGDLLASSGEPSEDV